MDRKSFILYASTKKQVELLNNEQAGILFKSIFEYVTNGKPLEMDGMTNLVYSIICDYLDRDAESYEKKCQVWKANGMKGGRPRLQAEPERTKENQEATKENQKEPSGSAEPEKKRKRFEPPSAEDVRKYATESGFDIDAERFVDYYTARGWELTNGRKVKDWKACVRTWKSNSREWGKKEKREGVRMDAEQRKDYTEFGFLDDDDES